MITCPCILGCSVVSNSFVTPWTVPVRFLCPWDFFPDRNTRVGCPSLPRPPNATPAPVSYSHSGGGNGNPL